jgi:DNA-binding transcriptional ArsR family regulator
LTGKPSLAYKIAIVSDVFEAIAAPARRAILDELVERDGQTLFELCSRLAMKHQLGLTRQAVSQHLEVLESAGLLSTARKGKYKLHYLHTAPLQSIAARWLKNPKEHPHENRRKQHFRGRSGKGIGLLHKEARIPKEKGRALGRSKVVDRRISQ